MSLKIHFYKPKGQEILENLPSSFITCLSTYTHNTYLTKILKSGSTLQSDQLPFQIFPCQRTQLLHQVNVIFGLKTKYPLHFFAVLKGNQQSERYAVFRFGIGNLRQFLQSKPAATNMLNEEKSIEKKC